MIFNTIFQNIRVQLDLVVMPAPGRTSHKDHKFKVGVSSMCRPCGVWISANPRASRVMNGPCEAGRKSSSVRLSWLVLFQRFRVSDRRVYF